MHEIRKSALAESDLIEIWLYTFEQWGAVQADRYFDELGAALERLRENPDLGKPCDGIREGYRALTAGRHVVYYTVRAAVVHVVRVLHGRMDPDRYL